MPDPTVSEHRPVAGDWPTPLPLSPPGMEKEEEVRCKGRRRKRGGAVVSEKGARVIMREVGATRNLRMGLARLFTLSKKPSVLSWPN